VYARAFLFGFCHSYPCSGEIGSDQNIVIQSLVVSFPSRTCSSLSLTAESYLIKTTNRDGMVLQHVREAPAGLPFPTGYPASCHVFLRSYGRMYIHAYLAFGLDNVARPYNA
jgi:hypothetical protein